MGYGAQFCRFAQHRIIDISWETSVQTVDKGVNLVLIADNPDRASMLRDKMEKTGINGVIRRLAPGTPAVDCARKSGAYREKHLPDLILFDYADPNEKNTTVLRDIAFSNDRARVPVVLLTSPGSQELLDTGNIGGNKAIMFSPTSLSSFVRKMKNGKRSSFFKALNTLYQYGPILVRLPESSCRHERIPTALSA
jgi:response regulator RpfG family c-di-GMP phosphodiesterase